MIIVFNPYLMESVALVLVSAVDVFHQVVIDVIIIVFVTVFVIIVFIVVVAVVVINIPPKNAKRFMENP